MWRPPDAKLLTPTAPATATGVPLLLVLPMAPRVPSPQQYTVPTLVKTHVCPSPVTNATAAGTDTGVEGGDNTFGPPTTPFPSCPFAFWPQQYTAPVDVNTHAWM